MTTPSEVGAATEAAVAAALVRAGKIVYAPLFGSYGRVDLIVDEEGRLLYSADLQHVFLVPVADAPSRECALRIAPTRNGQSARVRWAANYALS
jgi:hypothetical protein